MKDLLQIGYNEYYRMVSDESSAKIINLPLIGIWNYNFREKLVVEILDLCDEMCI